MYIYIYIFEIYHYTILALSNKIIYKYVHKYCIYKYI